MSYLRSPERHRQILECAKQVFAERGFHAANVSHICAAAGIGRGTLYLYFENKRAVLTAILREALQRVQVLMERQVADQADAIRFPAPEKVRRSAAIEISARQLREVLELVFADDAMVRIILREAVGLDVDVEHLLSEIDAALISIVERGLRDALTAGYVRELDPRIAATMIVGGVEKLALAALRSEAPVDLDALCLEAARLHAVGTLSDRLRPD